MLKTTITSQSGVSVPLLPLNYAVVLEVFREAIFRTFNFFTLVQGSEKKNQQKFPFKCQAGFTDRDYQCLCIAGLTGLCGVIYCVMLFLSSL